MFTFNVTFFVLAITIYFVILTEKNCDITLRIVTVTFYIFVMTRHFVSSTKNYCSTTLFIVDIPFFYVRNTIIIIELTYEDA